MNILEYESYQENRQHGELLFPYDVYPYRIPDIFSYVPLHWHEEIEILFIEKGQGLVTVNLKQYQVFAGSVILILPGQLHSIAQDKDACMEYKTIIFHPNLLISRQKDICTSDYIQPILDGIISVPTHFVPALSGTGFFSWQLYSDLSGEKRRLSSFYKRTALSSFLHTDPEFPPVRSPRLEYQTAGTYETCIKICGTPLRRTYFH